MIAIYKRELKSYFYSMAGWLFVAANILLSGIYFMALNLRLGYPSLASTVKAIVFLLMVTIPVLTMRTMSEERRQKTDQLLLTAPVTVGKIVSGKYLAALTVFAVPTAVLAVYPIILCCFGQVGFAESYTSILGYFLYGAASIAVGLFISCITESQIIAAVLSVGILFLGNMMSSICGMISAEGNILTRVLSAYDLGSRMNVMTQGTFELRAVVYFLTLIAVFLFLSVQTVQKRRYQVSVKTLKIGAYSTGMVVVVLVAAVFLNLALNELPAQYVSYDVTKEQLFSLTDTTKNMVANLEEDVAVYVLQSEKDKDETLDQTLQQYDDLSDHLSVEYKDPVTNPAFFQKYTDGSVAVNSIVVESAKRFKVIDYINIYAQEMDYSTYTSSIVGYDAEGQITSAIGYVTGDEMPMIYQLDGHNEIELSDAFEDGLVKQNADIKELNLIENDGVPADASALLILAPDTDLSDDDTAKILSYLEQGGKILMTTYYSGAFAQDYPNLQKVLDFFGLDLVDGIVVENDASRFYQQATFLLPEVMTDSVTNGIAFNKYIFMPYAKGITSDNLEDVQVKALLKSSDQAVSKADYANAATFGFEEGDAAGPFALGVRAVKTLGEGEAQLFLFPSETLFTDSTNSIVAGANLNLFTNCVAEMAGSVDSVSVPIKYYEASDIMVRESTALLIAAALLFIIPVGSILTGVIIWSRRRKR